MRRFMVHLVTEIDFVDGDQASDEILQNYQKHLAATVQNAAQTLSLRTIKAARVESVAVEEIQPSGHQAASFRLGRSRPLPVRDAS
jgi:hypothetical protein